MDRAIKEQAIQTQARQIQTHHIISVLIRSVEKIKTREIEV